MGQVSGDLFAGDVFGSTVVILDELFSTGTTMARVAQQCQEHGARRIAAATRGVGGTAALFKLSQPSIDEVLLANAIPQTPGFVAAIADRLTVLDMLTIFSRAFNTTDLAKSSLSS